jgi:hypothetical protein
MELVGAWGFEPQTPTVSTQCSTPIYPNNTGRYIIFRRPPAQLPAQFNLLLCYSRFSSSPHIHVEADPQLHPNRKQLQ